MKPGDVFADLLNRSVLIRGLVTLVLVATCCYLWITTSHVPTELLMITTGTVGFYFGVLNNPKPAAGS